jgi:hypothetical protein
MQMNPHVIYKSAKGQRSKRGPYRTQDIIISWRICLMQELLNYRNFETRSTQQ